MTPGTDPPDWNALLAGIARGKSVLECGGGHTIFMQGAPADSLFFLLRGKVQLAVASREGKEAIVATLAPGEFFGEGCLGGQTLRMATAVSVGDSTLAVVDKPVMARLLHEEHPFADMFIKHLLTRIVRYEADFVDQLFNSSEKRLARTLLLMARYGQANPQSTLPRVSQETLAQMIGATRARVNFFMNKFRKLGLIEYNGSIKINGALLGIVLHD
jgi:CRP/FNR family transcriptional regulator, cyclic AMP receptor protein